MYNLLVVDDETSAVEAITMTLLSEDININRIYKAYSGNEAYKIFETNTIDIVITDIRMPGMNGIDLIKKIRGQNKYIKCILLSGYAEFSYAQSALQNKVLQYLLKPIRDEELANAVKQATVELDKELEEYNDYIRVKDTITENMQILKNNLLIDLLEERKFSVGELENKLKVLELDFSISDRFVFMMVKIDKPNYQSIYENNNSLLPFSIGNIGCEIFENDFYIWTCKNKQGHIVILLKLKDHIILMDESIIQKNLKEKTLLFQQNVKRYLKRNISIHLSSWGEFPYDLATHYENCINHKKELVGKNDFYSTVIDHDMQDIQPLTQLYEPPLLIHLLESGRWGDVKIKLKAIFDELFQENISREHVIEAFYMISSSFIYMAHKNGRLLESIIGEEIGKITLNFRFESVKAFEEWAIDMVEIIKCDINNNVKSSQFSIVEHVQVFVENNLSNDVSLSTISEYVHLHPVYLSKVYKVETGESLSEYVLRLRMDKAYYLLTNTEDKIYEIAESVGLQNTSYFIRVFKKYFDVTPLEYRKNLTLQNH